MFTVVWVLCVCTCACVHSCLNSGYCSTLVLDLGLHRHLDCIVHLDLNFILAKTKLQAQQFQNAFLPEAHSVGLTLRLRLDFIWNRAWKAKWTVKQKDISKEERRAEGLACLLPLHLRAHCMVHDSWSTP